MVLGALHWESKRPEQIHNISQKGQSVDSLFPRSAQSKRFLQSARIKYYFLLGPGEHPGVGMGGPCLVSPLAGHIFPLLMTLLSLQERALFPRN